MLHDVPDTHTVSIKKVSLSWLKSNAIPHSMYEKYSE